MLAGESALALAAPDQALGLEGFEREADGAAADEELLAEVTLGGQPAISAERAGADELHEPHPYDTRIVADAGFRHLSTPRTTL